MHILGSAVCFSAFIYLFFLCKIIYFGCLRSLLRHTGSSFHHAGSFIEVHKFSRCGTGAQRLWLSGCSSGAPEWGSKLRQLLLVGFNVSMLLNCKAHSRWKNWGYGKIFTNICENVVLSWYNLSGLKQ